MDRIETSNWLDRITRHYMESRRYGNDKYELIHLTQQMLHVDIKDIVTDSCFYLSSGSDISPIIALNDIVRSFVFCDLHLWGAGKIKGIENSFLRHTATIKDRLIQQGFVEIQTLKLNNSFLGIEKLRYSNGDIEKLQNCDWSIWVYNDKAYSVLFINYDNNATFKSLYANNNIVPKAIWGWRPEWGGFLETFPLLYRLPEYLFGHVYGSDYDRYEELPNKEVKYFGDYEEYGVVLPDKILKKKEPISRFNKIQDLIEMEEVKGGDFWMGAQNKIPSEINYDPIAWKNEGPVRSTHVDDFFIGKHEVTQELWEIVMGYNPLHSLSSDVLLSVRYRKVKLSEYIYGRFPVVGVSWNDIVGDSSSQIAYSENGTTYYTNGFCYLLSAMINGGKLGSIRFRLPTEAEWEYAARGGRISKGFKYAGSNIIDEVGWCEDNSNGVIHAIGQKQPNELGLYDMSGNVYEWCNDHNIIHTWKGNDCVVARGGCYSHYNGASVCRITDRNIEPKTYKQLTHGFRLVMIKR